MPAKSPLRAANTSFRQCAPRRRPRGAHRPYSRLVEDEERHGRRSAAAAGSGTSGREAAALSLPQVAVLKISRGRNAVYDNQATRSQPPGDYTGGHELIELMPLFVSRHYLKMTYYFGHASGAFASAESALLPRPSISG